MKWFQPKSAFIKTHKAWWWTLFFFFSFFSPNKGTQCLYGQPLGCNSSDRPERPVQLWGIFCLRIVYFSILENRGSPLTLSHLTSAPAGFFFFFFLHHQSKSRSVCCCMCRRRVCGNHNKPCFDPTPILTGPTVVSNNIYQYILNNFWSLYFCPPAHHTYSTRRKKKTNTSHQNVIFVLWPISYRGAWQHEHSTVLFLEQVSGKNTQTNNKLPSQPTCGAFTASLQSM